ncbi:hypothetical protein [Streptomyces sp. NPDC046371]|uniref:hypothetical protein n=1 Tax=Streptomyces sp. NPDC046371 TaxID=3154916 RepID=UPI0033EAA5C1
MPETTTAQPEPSAAAPQGSHHWVMTLEIPGRACLTESHTWTPPAGFTRYDAYLTIRSSLVDAHPEMARANVVFFSITPNAL